MIGKLKTLEQSIADEKGSFRLFGLFLREDSHDKWNVVASASWFSTLSGDPIEFLSKRLKSAIGRTGLMMISRIVALAEADRFLAAVNDVVEVQHGLHEMRNIDLSGVQISQAYVITSLAKTGIARR